ncbi:hypothetical protein FJQ98_16375 [Lysinibacillus agricola]|uniref:Uncharacterized protein n=1 Tax=Lysinibacillus agricola TaxID=2590012 RepID=A0ABX7AM40_9BACI|nr:MULTISPECIES: hypothetical protein [Lysinibacillus]KOS61492.1 hypothetical protein AN161_18040 [Lysinibacillus sp. FJAT-14222]QQP10821.1 hypothetical protein FJQ98_16375 [Lysinibacillus agricola]
MMNEQERIQYIKGLSENGLMSEINYDDINFLIDIASRLQQFATEFDPVLTEGQMSNYAEAYQEVLANRN